MDAPRVGAAVGVPTRIVDLQLAQETGCGREAPSLLGVQDLIDGADWALDLAMSPATGQHVAQGGVHPLANVRLLAPVPIAA